MGLPMGLTAKVKINITDEDGVLLEQLDAEVEDTELLKHELPVTPQGAARIIGRILEDSSRVVVDAT